MNEWQSSLKLMNHGGEDRGAGAEGGAEGGGGKGSSCGIGEGGTGDPPAREESSEKVPRTLRDGGGALSEASRERSGGRCLRGVGGV